MLNTRQMLTLRIPDTQWIYPENMYLEDILEVLTDVQAIAKKDSWTNVRLYLSKRDYDENSEASIYYSFEGERLETDKEFEKRFKKEATKIKRKRLTEERTKKNREKLFLELKKEFED